MRRRFRAAKYGYYRVGSCRFWGPPEFLALCSRAIDQLATLDPGVHGSVLTENLELWYEPAWHVIFYGHFGVSDSFVAWKEQGVIACVIFLHLEAQLAHGRALWRAFAADPFAARQRVADATTAWLAKHGFPAELAAWSDSLSTSTGSDHFLARVSRQLRA